jgi:hypothetical protein
MGSLWPGLTWIQSCDSCRALCPDLDRSQGRIHDPNQWTWRGSQHKPSPIRAGDRNLHRNHQTTGSHLATLDAETKRSPVPANTGHHRPIPDRMRRRPARGPAGAREREPLTQEILGAGPTLANEKGLHPMSFGPHNRTHSGVRTEVMPKRNGHDDGCGPNTNVAATCDERPHPALISCWPPRYQMVEAWAAQLWARYSLFCQLPGKLEVFRGL